MKLLFDLGLAFVITVVTVLMYVIPILAVVMAIAWLWQATGRVQ